MICGDITDDVVFNKVFEASIERGVNVVLATPPCQGMSTAGTQKEDDERNHLVLSAIQMIQHLMPKYGVIENVPNFINTKIWYKGDKVHITSIISSLLEGDYDITTNIINTKDYGIAQSRERAIILLSRKDCSQWVLPNKDSKVVTLSDAIGWLPTLDPYVKDVDKATFMDMFPLYEERKQIALSISKWHIPPVHIFRQVQVMQHTPTGKSAFENDKYKPIKKDGSFARGYKNTYMRQRWDMPAYTITMDNRKISSQGNVHPGRPIQGNTGKIYSDARVLTLFELMLVMGLPKDWPLPHTANEAFVRRIIGEGIPPLFIKKLFLTLPNNG